MSSILKALQKLESETRGKDAGQPWLQNINAGQGCLEDERRFSGKSLTFLLLIGAVLAAALVFIFKPEQSTTKTPVPLSKTVQSAGGEPARKNDSRMISSGPGPGQASKEIRSPGPGKEDTRPSELSRDRTDPKASRQVPAPTAPMAPVAVGKNSESKGASPGTPVLPTISKGPAVKTPSPIVKDLTGRSVTDSAGSKVTPARRKLSALAPQPSATEQIVAEPIVEAAAVATKGEIEATLQPAAPLTAQRLHDPEMKLHAISWTRDPQTRIAVINGSIVREGGRAGRYVVIRINQDDIVLKENDEFWRLVIGRH